MKRFYSKISFSLMLVSAIILLPLVSSADFVIEGAHEAAVDLPRISFLLKYTPDGQAIEIGMLGFIEQYAFFDTGASGLLLSRETAIDYMQIELEPGAEYVDVGVGGNEYFDVSQQLYLGLQDYNSPQSANQHSYTVSGPWRFQVRQQYNEGLLSSPIDVIGVPAMAGEIVVLDSASTNQLRPFTAGVREPNDPQLPDIDFQIPLIFEKFIFPEDPINTPPYPSLAYNPLINNIVIDHNGVKSTGNYLLDTGGMISMISVSQAVKLGLTDSEGWPVIEPAFTTQVGGVGGAVTVWGFQVDSLKVATNKGFNLVYKDAKLGVVDISVYDPANDEFITLDGIFGSNFLCATMSSEIDINDVFNFDISGTPYDNIVIDMKKGYIGFDVNDLFPVPKDSYQMPDLIRLCSNWLLTDCNYTNNYCHYSDINTDGTVNLSDYVEIAKWWYNSRSAGICGNLQKPFLFSDFNRDCKIDIKDIYILADNWLSTCGLLTFGCKYTDINNDLKVNFIDFAEFTTRTYQ